MRSDENLRSLLSTQGFRLQGLLAEKLGVGILGQSALPPLLFAALFLAGSYLDHSLILTGRDVGLLEHPGIWSLLLFQAVAPPILRRSVRQVVLARNDVRKVITSKLDFYRCIVVPIVRHVRMRSLTGRLIGTLFYVVGLTAYVWNTYQDQFPRVVVPFDFWDSDHFVCGFWLTRIYKFYLLVLFLPYISLVYSAIVVVVLGFIRRTRLLGRVRLLPFDADGVGGLGFAADLLSGAIAVLLLIGFIANLSAFLVHRAFDITPVMGLGVLLAAAAAAYGFPTIYLRKDIKALKRRSLGEVATIEQAALDRMIMQEQNGEVADPKAASNLAYFEDVRRHIASISEYPYFRRFTALLGLSASPTLVSIIVDIIHADPVLFSRLHS